MSWGGKKCGGRGYLKKPESTTKDVESYEGLAYLGRHDSTTRDVESYEVLACLSKNESTTQYVESYAGLARTRVVSGTNAPWNQRLGVHIKV
jgi:hypothetical protein